jgi:molybdopterin synthase catalytic subunit
VVAIVQAESFDPAQHHARLKADAAGGALVSFTGYVRDYSGDRSVHQLELEHYPGMTEKALQKVGERAHERFQLSGWRIVHRYGLLDANDVIVWCGVVAPHRGDAFDGCRYMMDVLKTDVPFWKREYGSGGAHWVEAKQVDRETRERWGDG